MRPYGGTNPQSINDPVTRSAVMALHDFALQMNSNLTTERQTYQQGTDLVNDPGGGVTSHGDLTGLSADDHPQYLLLAGRAPGQTLTHTDRLTIPFTIKGAVSQSADFFRINDSSDNDLFSFKATGGMFLSSGTGNTTMDYGLSGLTQTRSLDTTGLSIIPQTGIILGRTTSVAPKVYIDPALSAPNTSPQAWDIYLRAAFSSSTRAAVLISNQGAGTGPLTVWQFPEGTNVASVTSGGYGQFPRVYGGIASGTLLLAGNQTGDASTSGGGVTLANATGSPFVLISNPTHTFSSGGVMALDINFRSTQADVIPNGADHFRIRNTDSSTNLLKLSGVGAASAVLRIGDSSTLTDVTSSYVDTLALRIEKSGRGAYLEFLADAATVTHTLTWPASSAAGVLTNNGSGTLTWAAAGGGSGDVIGDDVSVTDQNIVAYNGTDGKHIEELTGTQGDVLYHDGTIWAKLGAGTAGHLLKTGGGGANPSWQANDNTALANRTRRIFFPAAMWETTAKSLGGTNPFAMPRVNCAGTSDTYVHLTMLVPDDYASGAQWRVHWSSAAAHATNVWRCRFILRDVTSAATLTASGTETTISVSVNGITADTHYMTTGFTNPDGLTYTAGNILRMNWCREASTDGSDNHTSNVYFYGMELIYTADM